MKKKQNKELLNEEIKRFRQLNEYSFYVPEDYDEYDNPENLILGEEGDEDVDAEADIDLPDDAEATGGEDMGDEFSDEEDEGEDFDAEADVDVDADVDADIDMEEPMDMEPAEDEVELDVTQLVQGTEEAKASADMANQKLDGLMGMLNNLESQLDSMNNIHTKIDNLENEFEKRVPTDDEKIEMRSLNSYPYNLKLTDYWADKDGQYDVMGNADEKEPEEYVLTQKDVEDDYNELGVRDSLNNDFEEEDIV
jgi:hypothetical protein